MKHHAIQGLVLAAGVSARSAPKSNPLLARDIVAIGPSGTCPAFPTITVQVQPAYYEEYIPYNTVIDPFRNGNPVTVWNAPTVVYTSTYLTTTIYPGSTTTTSTTSGATSTSMMTTTTSSSSNNVGPTLISTTSSTSTASGSTSTSTSSVSGASSSGTSTSGQGTSTSTASGSTSSGSTSSTSGSSTTTVSATSTSITLTSATTSASSGSSTSSSTTGTSSGTSSSTSAASTAIIIGAGIQPGTVTTGQNFVLLAFGNPGGSPGNKKRDVLAPRQALAAGSTAVVAVQLPGTTGLVGGVTADQCDSSSPLSLLNGQLVGPNGQVVGKTTGDTAPTFGFYSGPAAVNTGFSLFNGMLQWNAPDLGVAVFYNCAGVIKAQFSGVTPVNCAPLTFGAVNGNNCLNRVRASGRTPNPAFGAPVVSSSTSSAVSTSSSASTVSTSVATTTSGSASVITTTSGSASVVSSTTQSGSATATTTTSSRSVASSTTQSGSASVTTATSSGPVTTTTTRASSSSTTTSFSQMSFSNSTTTRTVTPTTTTRANVGGSQQTGSCSTLSNPYTAGNSQQYDVTCNSYYGYDNTNTLTTNTQPYMSLCIESCANTSGCVAVDYISDSNSASYQDCILLSNTSEGFTNPYAGIDSAMMQSTT